MASSTTFLALRSPDCNSTLPGMTYAFGQIRLWSSLETVLPFPPGREISRYKIGKYSRTVVSESGGNRARFPRSFMSSPPSADQSSINIGAKRRVMIINAIKVSTRGRAWILRVFRTISLLLRFERRRKSERRRVRFKVRGERSRIVEVDWLFSKL